MSQMHIWLTQRATEFNDWFLAAEDTLPIAGNRTCFPSILEVKISIMGLDGEEMQ